MSASSQSACPDLIVLYAGAGHLNVFAYRIGVRLKTLLWRERVTCPAAGDPLSDLPAALARHPLGLSTATALVADPASGGFLLLQGPAGAQHDRVWIERHLASALPYTPGELYWRTRPGLARLELFWLPKAWAESQSGALARLGLRLEEVYPRAALLRIEAEKSAVQQPCLFQEADALHAFDQGLVQRSALLPAEGEAAAQAQQLERLALGSNASSLRKLPAESEETLARRILDVWLDGRDAIHLPVGRWPGGASWRPALTLSVVCAAVVAIAAIGLSWQNAAMENTLEDLSRDQRKLAPVAQKFSEMERSIRSDRQYLEAAKVLDKSPLPLEALTRVSAALPDKYWVQRMQFKGNTLELAGRGGASDEVIRLLAKKGVDAVVSEASESPAASPDAVSKDAYQIRLDVNKLPAGGGR